MNIILAEKAASLPNYKKAVLAYLEFELSEEKIIQAQKGLKMHGLADTY